MRTYFYLFFALFLFPFITNAQSNYKPARVVTLKGDTISGFIDYKEWENNPGSINFKTALYASAQKFTPNDIVYFSINEAQTYKTYSGPITTDQIEVNKLAHERDTSFITATVFLKVLQDGKNVILYSYTDDIKTRYFISEKTDNHPVELICRWYFKPETFRKTINENTYKEQLNILAKRYNVADLWAMIQNASYDVDIIKVVTRINNFIKKPAVNKNPSSSFFVGISEARSNLSGVKSNTNYTDITRNKYSLLPRISAGMDFYPNPDVKKLVFRAEFIASVNKYQTYYKEYIYPEPDSYIKLNLYMLSFVPQIIYNVYNTEALKFYLDGGASFNKSKFGDKETYNGKYNTKVVAKRYDPDSGIIWVSVPLSAGVVFNSKLGVYLTYTASTYLPSYENFTYNSMGIGVTYNFGQSKSK